MEKIEELKSKFSNYWSPPYIGESYFSQENYFNGLKILTIGHSQYCTAGEKDDKGEVKDYYYKNDTKCSPRCPAYKEKGKCPNATGHWTEDVVTAFKNYHKRKLELTFEGEIEAHATYTNFANILGATNDSNKILGIWDSFVFYNFLQNGVQKWDKFGLEEEYKKSIALFKNFMIGLAESDALPDIIIVWGKQVPKYLPYAKIGEHSFYALEGQDTIKIPIVFIDHPMRPKFEDSQRKIRKVNSTII